MSLCLSRNRFPTPKKCSGDEVENRAGIEKLIAENTRNIFVQNCACNKDQRKGKNKNEEGERKWAVVPPFVVSYLFNPSLMGFFRLLPFS